MITITSYLHGHSLRDLISRWMHGEAHPDDGNEIVRLVYFNNAFVSRYLGAFSAAIFQRLQHRPFQTRRVFLKGDLKDVIVANVPYRNARIDELVLAYRIHPERYYRETPFHGNLYFISGPEGHRYIGSNRIKRVRRLAEKSARRIIDSMFDAIKRRAETLAEDRARSKGIQKEQMFTTPEDMIAEFLKAESRLLEDLKQGRPLRNDDGLVIQDVAGLKLIVEDAERDRFIEVISGMEGCEVIEIEPHSGRYNAINLIVRYRPDKGRMVAAPLGRALLAVMQGRGIAADQANRAFRQFVYAGDSAVNVEIILSNYQEMLESEIGRCMHEDRIVHQRLEQQYNGQLARNIEYLMSYLFAFPASGKSEVTPIPIKLWHRYLPDYFDDVLKRLFNIPSVEVLE